MRNTEYAILLAVVCIALGICAAMLFQPSHASRSGRAVFAETPSEAAWSVPEPPGAAVQDGPQDGEGGDEAVQESGYGQDAAQYTDDVETAPYSAPGQSWGIYVADYDAAYNEDGPTREMPGWHDGRKETYYSSNVLYHYRTGEWTVDEDGFYRTGEGYYVVGVTLGDYELGDTFEGGRGTCYVADSGYADEPITDYYTNW